MVAALSIFQLPIAQCQDNFVVYGPPIVCLPADYNNIHYSGSVHSKKYVTAVFGNGQIMTVPVINGMLPTVDYKMLPSGGMQRDFWYDEEFKYRGQEIVKYNSAYEKKKIITPPSRPENLPPKKQMPDPKIQQLEASIGDLQKTIVELREEVKKQQTLVVPELKKTSSMRKPSEFDKESK